MSTTVNDRSLSGNDISVFLSPQSVKGVIDTSPVFDKFRRLEGKPIKVVAYTTSNEVKSNRQARQQIQESTTNSAELSFELNESTAKYLDGLLHGDPVDNGIAAQTTVETTATGMTDSGSGLDDLLEGDWFKATGFADADNDSFYKVGTVNSPGDFDTIPVPASVEAAGASVTIETRKTVSGNSPTYYTMQSRTLDKSAPGDLSYDTFVDGLINTGSIEIGETGIVTGSFAFNIETNLPGVTEISGQTDNAVDNSRVAVASGINVKKIYVDGVNTACEVKSMGFEFDNANQGDRSAECSGERSVATDISVSGALVTRAVISNTFEWRSRYRNETRIALAVLIEFDSTNWMIIEIMQATISEHAMPGGPNIIVSNEMTYTAEESDVTGTTVQLFRNFS